MRRLKMYIILENRSFISISRSFLGLFRLIEVIVALQNNVYQVKMMKWTLDTWIILRCVVEHKPNHFRHRLWKLGALPSYVQSDRTSWNLHILALLELQRYSETSIVLWKLPWDCSSLRTAAYRELNLQIHFTTSAKVERPWHSISDSQPVWPEWNPYTVALAQCRRTCRAYSISGLVESLLMDNNVTVGHIGIYSDDLLES